MKLSRWTHAAEANLRACLGADRDELRRQVNTGIAELWRIYPDTYMVTRIERDPGARPDVVVCCLAGHGLRDIVPRIKETARRQGLRGVRCHIRRRGMARMLAPFGFRECDRVPADPRDRVLFAEV